MNPNILKVAWTIMYQPTQVDVHEVEPELLVRVRVPSLSEGHCGETTLIHAFERRTPWGTEYEPVYVELLDHHSEPDLILPKYFDPAASEHPMERPMPERTEILALGVSYFWEQVAVAPRLARIETDEEGEEQGLTVAYSLLEIGEVIDGGAPDLWSGFRRRLRTVISPGGGHSYQPFFLTCCSYS